MSDSIENILINIVRDSNNHIDKINNSVLSNNKLLQTLVEKINKIEEENLYLRKKIDSFSDSNVILHEKIEKLTEVNMGLSEKVEAFENVKSKKPVVRVAKEPKIECSMFTAKGNKCTKPCVPGETCCTLHLKMRDKKTGSEKNVKKRPILKKKKDTPVHNHKPGETPTETCELCESHGDIFDPDMPNSQFEESQDNEMSIEEKLRKMLEEEKDESV
jgi:hypothetical protein